MEQILADAFSLSEVHSMCWRFTVNLFFFLECYHFITHSNVLFRVRLLPRKDLVRARYYFLIDTTCVFVVNFLIVKRLRFIAVLQIIQHVYYWYTWDKSSLAKKVISWSSLEWQQLPHSISMSQGAFEFIGTVFDWLLHLVNSYFLASQLTSQEVIMGIALVYVSVQMLLYNPRFAWSTPKSMPDWVAKRLNPLKSEDMPITPGDKLLGMRPDSYLHKTLSEKDQ